MSEGGVKDVDGSTSLTADSVDETAQNPEGRDRIVKGAMASGAMAGIGMGVAGLGLGAAGLGAGAVIGVAAGGAMGLAAFGQGGKINHFAQATGRQAVKGYDKAKAVDEKYHISEKGKQQAQKVTAKAKEVNQKYEIDTKARQMSGKVAVSVTSFAGSLAKRASDARAKKAGEEEGVTAGPEPSAPIELAPKAVEVDEEVMKEEMKEEIVEGEFAEEEPEEPETIEKEALEMLQATIAVAGQENVVHDLRNPKVLTEWLNEAVELTEGSKMQESWSFLVHKPLDDVTYKRTTHKSGIRVSKEKIKLGSFAPRATPYTFMFEELTLPSGALVRGQYRTKMVLKTADGHVLLSRTAVAKITKGIKE